MTGEMAHQIAAGNCEAVRLLGGEPADIIMIGVVMIVLAHRATEDAPTDQKLVAVTSKLVSSLCESLPANRMGGAG